MLYDFVEVKKKGEIFESPFWVANGIGTHDQWYHKPLL